MLDEAAAWSIGIGGMVVASCGAVAMRCRSEVRHARRAAEEAEARAVDAERRADARAALAARQASIDPLTGLLARTAIEPALEDALRRGTAAVAFVDLDRFKAINDTAGHHVGDEVLRVVARRLAAVVRSKDVCCRVGGDEFVVVSDQADEAGASALGQRLLGVLDDPISVSGRHFSVSASVGVAVVCPGTSAERALAQADAAMYSSKRAGGRRLCVVGRETTTTVLPVEVASALERALDNRELVQVYQPLFSIHQGAPVGFEALARWPSSELGRQVPPSEFIPVAESSGLIVRLGEWALRTALGQAALWAATVRPFGVSVNVSALQLAEEGFPALVEQSLADAGVPPERLTLEVTESTVMNHAEATDRLRALRAKGVRISLDDFGTGHSSLARLADLEVDELKVDRAFVSRLDDAPALRVVEFVARVADDLGCEVVAEGVENAEVLRTVSELGVDVAQGWAVGRPMTASDALAWLRRREQEPAHV